jgi:hypothetical protein
MALTVGAVLLSLACVAALAGGLMLPVRVEANPPRDLPNHSAGRAGDPNGEPADPNHMQRVYRDLQRLVQLDLRRPLIEPAAPPKEETKSKPAPRLRLRLLGTAQEPGHSLAYFQKVDGTTTWLSEGDRLKTPAGEVVVQAITSEQVTVTVGGQTTELKVPIRSWQKERP